VAQTFVDINKGISVPGADQGISAPPAPKEQLTSTQLFAIGMAAQSWMTGFLVGKISSGSFATGFRYSIMLLAISTGAMVMTQEFHLSPSAFFSQPPSNP
jgi:hypothetical protein